MSETGEARRPLLIGWANAVTTLRAILAMIISVPVVASLTMNPFVATDIPRWVIAVVVVGLLLDGVDGAIARRTNTTSEFGARYDMEVDAALIMVLCLPVARLCGAWVLLIGLARYLWIVLEIVFPRIGTPVRPRYWRKIVAVVQAVALLLALTGWLPPLATTVVMAFSLAVLMYSFISQGIEAVWVSRPTPRH